MDIEHRTRARRAGRRAACAGHRSEPWCSAPPARRVRRRGERVRRDRADGTVVATTMHRPSPAADGLARRPRHRPDPDARPSPADGDRSHDATAWMSSSASSRSPSRPSVIRPGPVTLVVHNAGQLTHGFEMKLERSGRHRARVGDRRKIETRTFQSGETLRVEADLPRASTRSSATSRTTPRRACARCSRSAPMRPCSHADAGTATPGTAGSSSSPSCPATLSVPVGASVTWTNDDPRRTRSPPMTAPFDSKQLEPGATFSVVFDTPGSFAYHCEIHPTMVGAVQSTDRPSGCQRPSGRDGDQRPRPRNLTGRRCLSAVGRLHSTQERISHRALGRPPTRAATAVDPPRRRPVRADRARRAGAGRGRGRGRRGPVSGRPRRCATVAASPSWSPTASSSPR